MRTTKELLILLRDKLPEYMPHKSGGLCGTINFIKKDMIISYEEHLLLFDFLLKNKPSIIPMGYYWWEEGKLEPRINWLNEQIEKL